MTILQRLENTELFNNASSESKQLISAFANLKKVKKGHHLFYDREEECVIYLLLEGLASLYKINSLGEKKVIFAYGAGNLLNEETLQGLPTSINCEMRTDSIVLVLNRDKFLKVMESDASLMKAVLDSMALKIRRLYRQLKNTSNALSGEKRLAAKLYKLAKDYGVETGDGIRIDMNLSITYLAEMLGSKRETVSRQVKKLNELCLIRSNKSQFFVPDLVKLSNYFKSP